jgi:vacuolar-type H+-ATPase subunit I/STV1
MGAGPSIVWTLRPISQGLDSSARESERNLTLWLSLRRELSQVNQLIVRAEALVPEQRAEVERISESIQDVPKFKARADEKYRELVRMLDEQRQILDQRQREVQDLAQRFEIAQRVTGMGKLVSLARESFERENRWFDSMLRAAPAGLSGSVQEAIQRGEKIIELKREIRKERAKLGLEARAGNAQVQGAP